jgi:hypothetical protein
MVSSPGARSFRWIGTASGIDHERARPDVSTDEEEPAPEVSENQHQRSFDDVCIESLAVAMFHLPGKHFRRWCPPAFGEAREHVAPADNPEHGESAQGIDGHDAFAARV